ncbi:MAG: helix-turn-helix domain-containing protein [Planctomycetes bacterium]|nr:helix-turn-helix domain-containing protein [Planctomycetota bacterium]
MSAVHSSGDAVERLIASVDGLRDDLRKALELIATQSKCRDDVTPRPADPQQLLTAEEVAKLLRVDQRTLRTMRHERSFPRPTRVGRSLRWRRSAVERWIDGGAR